MSHKLSRQQILEDLPVYALGALEPDEMLTIDNYLADNPEPELLARLQELDAAVVELAVALPDIPLPPSAKAQLFERVQKDLAVRHKHQIEAPPLSTPTISGLQPDLLSRFQIWLDSLFSGATRPLAWAAASALLVILLGGSTIYQLQQELKHSQAELLRLEEELSMTAAQLEALQSDVEELELNNRELEQINKQLKQEQSDIDMQLALLTNNPNEIALSGTDKASTAKGSLFFTNKQGLLVLDGLKPLPENEDYQVWLIPADGAPEPGKLIEVASEATTSQIIELSGNPLDYAAFGISQEPAGGSETPTLVVMVGLIEQ